MALHRVKLVYVLHHVKSSIFCVSSQFTAVKKWLFLFRIKVLKHRMTFCTSKLVESFICKALHWAKLVDVFRFAKSSIFCVRSQFAVVSKWLFLLKFKTLKQ